MFPCLLILQILNSITEDLLDHLGSFKNPLDQCDYIKNEIENSGMLDPHFCFNWSSVKNTIFT